MLIDCDTCAVRHVQCGDCVMTVLLRGPGDQPGGYPGVYEVDPDEAAALGLLAEWGMVPKLQLVPFGPPGQAPAQAS